jgi:hypothetical protein
MQSGESLLARARCCIVVLWDWSTSPTYPGAKTLSHGQCRCPWAGSRCLPSKSHLVTLTLEHVLSHGLCSNPCTGRRLSKRSEASGARAGGELMRHDLGSVGTPCSSEKLWFGVCSGFEDRVQVS